jgi:hypothetical protein
VRLVLALLVLLAALSGPAEARMSRQGFRGPRVSHAALEAARRFLCPFGGTPQGRGRCAPGSRLGMLGSDPEVRGWDRGLTAPTHTQTPCPPGTTPGPARAQPGVTRCIAG